MEAWGWGVGHVRVYCLKEAALERSVTHFGVGQDCRDHGQHGAVQDAVPSGGGGVRGVELQGKCGCEPVAREQLHALHRDVVVGASLLRRGIGQTQHVAESFNHAQAGEAHEGLMRTDGGGD